MHLNNITAQNPKTIEQYELSRRYSILWLFSEDGKDWYEEQKNFAPDTIKVAYTSTGEVVWVGKDVSAINPVGLSVTELADITANRQIKASGYWFYRDGKFVFDYALKAEDERNARLMQIIHLIGEWEKDLLLDLISDEDKEKLKQYRLYARALRKLNLSTVIDKASFNAITWPEPPVV